MAIKYLHMRSAAGEVAPMVLIVAVDLMKESGLYVIDFPGLNYYTISGKYSYLVLVNNRAGNSPIICLPGMSRQ